MKRRTKKPRVKITGFTFHEHRCSPIGRCRTIEKMKRAFEELRKPFYDTAITGDDIVKGEKGAKAFVFFFDNTKKGKA